MAKLTAGQVYALARDAGLSPQTAIIATAVAMGESKLDPDAVGDRALVDSKWGPSIGLWQIRSLKAETGTGGTRDASRLADPKFNAASMAKISGTGGNFKPWSVYTSGKWRDNLPTVIPAVTDSVSVLNPLESAGETVAGVAGQAADVVGGVVDKLNPFAVFDGWQNDLQGLAIKWVVMGAAAWLIVAGVVAAAGGSDS